MPEKQTSQTSDLSQDELGSVSHRQSEINPPDGGFSLPIPGFHSKNDPIVFGGKVF